MDYKTMKENIEHFIDYRLDRFANVREYKDIYNELFNIERLNPEDEGQRLYLGYLEKEIIQVKNSDNLKKYVSHLQKGKKIVNNIFENDNFINYDSSHRTMKYHELRYEKIKKELNKNIPTNLMSELESVVKSANIEFDTNIKAKTYSSYMKQAYHKIADFSKEYLKPLDDYRLEQDWELLQAKEKSLMYLKTVKLFDSYADAIKKGILINNDTTGDLIYYDHMKRPESQYEEYRGIAQPKELSDEEIDMINRSIDRGCY